MRELMICTGVFEARAIASYLLEQGVVAGVESRMSDLSPDRAAVLVEAVELATARRLVSEMPREQAGPQPEAPDLSRLDPWLAPPCPACGASLPLDASVERCAACAEPIDVAELIALRHGPESLEVCYGEGCAHPEGERSELDGAQLERLALTCPRCRYALSGLRTLGNCPECGLGFDKRELVRKLMG